MAASCIAGGIFSIAFIAVSVSYDIAVPMPVHKVPQVLRAEIPKVRAAGAIAIRPVALPKSRARVTAAPDAATIDVAIPPTIVVSLAALTAMSSNPDINCTMLSLTALGSMTPAIETLNFLMASLISGPSNIRTRALLDGSIMLFVWSRTQLENLCRVWLLSLLLAFRYRLDTLSLEARANCASAAAVLATAMIVAVSRMSAKALRVDSLTVTGISNSVSLRASCTIWMEFSMESTSTEALILISGAKP